MKLVTSTDISLAVADFLANGGSVTPVKAQKKLPSYLEYGKGLSAKGRNRGQMGPNRDFRLGWPTQAPMSNM